MMKFPFRQLSIIIVASTVSLSSFSQAFTWKHGSKLANQWGIYGSLGIPSPTNCPGARNEACSWMDNAGNFWVFGGAGYDNFGHVGGLNDLWKYTPSNNTWTWM